MASSRWSASSGLAAGAATAPSTQPHGRHRGGPAVVSAVGLAVVRARSRGRSRPPRRRRRPPAPPAGAAGPGSALAALAAVPVKGRAPKTGYSRDRSSARRGPTSTATAATPATTSSRRDLTADVVKPGTHGCVVLTGTLADPYSGTHDQLPARAGHQRRRADRPRRRALRRLAEGRAELAAAQRTAFANDPLNLLAVDGPPNMAKGDGDAATWLPPNKAYRCAYVARQVAVKAGYGLWMTQAEKNAIASVLGHLPHAAAARSAPPRSCRPRSRRPPAARLPAPAPAPAPRPAPAPAGRGTTRTAPRPAPPA